MPPSTSNTTSAIRWADLPRVIVVEYDENGGNRTLDVVKKIQFLNTDDDDDKSRTYVHEANEEVQVAQNEALPAVDVEGAERINNEFPIAK